MRFNEKEEKKRKAEAGASPPVKNTRVGEASLEETVADFAMGEAASASSQVPVWPLARGPRWRQPRLLARLEE